MALKTTGNEGKFVVKELIDSFRERIPAARNTEVLNENISGRQAGCRTRRDFELSSDRSGFDRMSLILIRGVSGQSEPGRSRAMCPVEERCLVDDVPCSKCLATRLADRRPGAMHRMKAVPPGAGSRAPGAHSWPPAAKAGPPGICCLRWVQLVEPGHLPSTGQSTRMIAGAIAGYRHIPTVAANFEVFVECGNLLGRPLIFSFKNLCVARGGNRFADEFDQFLDHELSLIARGLQCIFEHRQILRAAHHIHFEAGGSPPPP